ncbi:trehalose-6-phosphate synthase [Hamadaea sp. NPDC050747]|uniref:alpha,alpha-trehalose-phosphate synthase (UDP-forming) n=1 Tax=Hamadaea sp. NPDC050747 TaxID=3155789 RepID=UPI0033DBA6F8
MRTDFVSGYCAQSLSPTFHGIGRPTFRRSWAEAYRQANELFADRLAEMAAPGATVWLHDFHLLQTPSHLRRMRPDLRIGVQLHSPFPPPELLMRLPDRARLIDGLVGADLIAVAETRSADNVGSAVADMVRRQPHTQVIPLGVDAAGIRALAEDPAVRRAAAELRNSFGESPTVFLSVGRLDAAQGLQHRLDAFEALLAGGRLDPARTVLALVVTADDRTDEAAELRCRIEQAVAGINGRYGRVGRPVVHHLYRSLNMRDTVVLYLAADVLLATPLAGGTDLTAQEFVAARRDATGRLIFSELNATCSHLPEAYQVNPHHLENTVETMTSAASQAHVASPDMAIMRERVSHHDAAHQTRLFLSAVGGGPDVRSAASALCHRIDATSQPHREQTSTSVALT